MPEREFELYLSLLSKFLKLNPAQRGDVADELRDHLEARLEELAAQGHSREQAIHKALAEFGDAAELAQHFTRAARIRRRRLIMRCTYGTAAALAAMLLIATAYWPEPKHPMAAQAVAQSEQKPAAAAPAATGPATAPAVAAAPPFANDEDARNAVLEAKLDRPIDVKFAETPLEEVISFIRQVQSIDAIIDRGSLVEEGVQTDSPITLELTGFKVRTVLDAVLDPLQLTYIVRDGLLMITTKTKADERLVVRVYNVQDLVAHLPDEHGPEAPAAEGRLPPQAGGGATNMGFFSVESVLAGMTPALMGQGFGSAPSDAATPQKSNAGTPQKPIARLMSVIQTTVDPDSWQAVGGAGNMSPYDGLIVVRQSYQIHRSIAELLERMRHSMKLDPKAGARAAAGF